MKKLKIRPKIDIFGELALRHVNLLFQKTTADDDDIPIYPPSLRPCECEMSACIGATGPPGGVGATGTAGPPGEPGFTGRSGPVGGTGVTGRNGQIGLSLIHI